MRELAIETRKELKAADFEQRLPMDRAEHGESNAAIHLKNGAFYRK